jgi:hypothetical protein
MHLPDFMRHAALAIAIVILLLGCRPAPLPPATPATPPLSPPPLPERNPNIAQVSGRVVDRTGLGVDGAWVEAWAAGADCAVQGGSVRTVSDAGGNFSLAVERGVGPDESGCVILEARAGGASGRAERPVIYSSTSGDPGREVEIRLTLGEPPPLDQGAGERVIGLLDRSMRGDHDAMRELDLYIRGDLGRVGEIVNAHSSWLRGIRAIELIESEEGRRLRWRLRGLQDRTVTITLVRNGLLELHGPLVDYGDRGAAFVRRILDVAHQGDADRMARLLDPDDLPVPREAAQHLIDRLRAKFDLPRATVVLAGVDELGNALRYSVRGPSRTGEQSEEILEVGFGDGLVALRGL